MKASTLKRPQHPLPADVKHALTERKLTVAYKQRPPYQQNDYIGWITRAKREETRNKRILQMLDELAVGDRYMKMPYRPKV